MAGASPADHHLAPVAAQVERAWHLLTVLVRLGRPVSPSELASSCFIALSPHHVEFLCRIPGSPLLLTDGGFVTISGSAEAAFLEFLSLSVSPFPPRVAVKAFAQMRPRGNVLMMCTRKKKARLLEDDLSVDLPSAKRRIILSTEDLEETEGDNKKLVQLLIANCAKSATKEELHINLMFPAISNYLSVASIVCGNPLIILNQKCTLPVKIDSAMDANGEKFNKLQAMGLNVVRSNIQSYSHNHCDAKIRSSILSGIMYKGIVVNERSRELDFQDPTNGRPVHSKTEMETLIGRNPLLPNRIKLDLNDNKIYDDHIIGQALGPTIITETTRTFCCRSGKDTYGINPSKENLGVFPLEEQTLGMMEPSVTCLSSSLEAVHNEQSKAAVNPHSVEATNLCMGLHSSTLPIDHHSNYPSLKKNQENKDPCGF